MNSYTMQFDYLEHKGNENSGRYRRGSGMRPYQHGGLFNRFKRGGATVKTSKKISKGSPSNKNRGPTNNPQNNHQNQNQNRLPGYDERRPGQNYKKSVKEVSKMSDRELNDHVSRLRKQKEARQISNYLLDKHAHDKPKPDSIFVKAGREVGEKALKGAGSYSLKALTQGKFDKYELGEAMFYGGPGGKKQVTQTVKKVVKHDDINSNYLIHYGVKGKSGRYPLGSGLRPHQHDAYFNKKNIKKLYKKNYPIDYIEYMQNKKLMSDFSDKGIVEFDLLFDKYKKEVIDTRESDNHEEHMKKFFDFIDKHYEDE